ncbi:2,3-bisphosphoglycerate-independent phosphoglycerate mutase [Candidatus Collierbacteria bacterium]|nr:2,3-bisphosphoglycerate-independent phosphoglycerate mutase [Candidatus Collierbacteria bacterium]
MNPSHPSVILCILDGWGIAPSGPGNAITLADPPTYTYLLSTCPNSQLEASGVAVGLPAQQDGNTETGHLNIGAGRIVYQDLARINLSIADGSFFTNQALLNSIEHVKKNHSSLHLLGLIGASGVHAFNDHLYALIMLAAKNNIPRVFLHLITDGRDSPPDDSPRQIKAAQCIIDRYRTGRIVSLMGRYYGLDRDMRLDRTNLAFDCLIKGSPLNYNDPLTAISTAYAQNQTDEFIRPLTIGSDPESTRIKSGDALIFYNFRIDRPRQLTKMLIDANIPGFSLTTMTKYHDHFSIPVAFPNLKIKNTLGEHLSLLSLHQLRMAESEKERFVTFYFNGQHEPPFPGEERIIVPSPKIATYDLQPEMSTEKLVAKFAENFSTRQYSFGLLNIACPDMVAHTGDTPSTIKAILAADCALKTLVSLADKTSSWLLITGDHGNAEEMINPLTSKADTEHSLNPVPLIIYHQDKLNLKLANGVLADIAPTILDLLKLPQPPEMTGNNLIINTK